MIRELIQQWNESHPHLRQKTLTSVANEIGCSKSYLSRKRDKQTKVFKQRLETIKKLLQWKTQ